MSLFPAYAAADIPSTSAGNIEPEAEKTEAWMLNPSFNLPPVTALQATQEGNGTPSTETDPIEAEVEADISPGKRKKSKKEHKRKKSRKAKSKEEGHKEEEKRLEFTGKENYYVDKKSDSGFFGKDTLDKSNCPRYRTHLRRVGKLTAKELRFLHRNEHAKSRRYFSPKFMRQFYENDVEQSESSLRKAFRLGEEEFALRTKSFNQRLNESPKSIETWLEYVGHQECFYAKLTKLQLAERKLEILNKALREIPDGDALKKTYVDILEQTYPSFEVSKILDTLLDRDPANFILWNSQIMATQGSMARCNVPDVLSLYKRCMKNMYKRNRIDEITLKLFGSCCYFLRQSGLSEQFFALIGLALELNVNDVTFASINRSDDSISNTLIEYEEIVLQSGLPMNEIWLRVEKLRQNFYFLPLSSERGISDPQRIVLNEDIYHYIYPLTNRENAFSLTLLILRLLKVPLPCNFWLRNNFLIPSTIASCDNHSEFDAIEELLPIFLNRTIVKSSGEESFNEILWQMIFDLNIGPSYISRQIGFELYAKYISEVLLLCADSFSDSKRDTFTLLWLKLERMQMLIDMQLKSWTDEKAGKLRSKIKSLVKRPENRNKLIYYVEFALIEYDLGHLDAAKNIFVAAIGQCTDADVSRAEFWFACVSLVEILMREGATAQALNILTVIALEGRLDRIEAIDCSDAQRTLALKKITDRLNELTFVERNVEIMEIEQGILPDYYINMIKAKIYLHLLWPKADDDPAKCLETLLRTFIEKNPRHNALREHIYEIYISALLYVNTENRRQTLSPESAIFGVVCRALDEFPTNLFFLKQMSICEGQTWHKLRTSITKHITPQSLIFLVAVAQYRCKKYTAALKIGGRKLTEIDACILDAISSDMNAIEQTYKTRVHNVLRRVTADDGVLRKNSLIWRLYLRSTLDVAENFEKSKNILFLALNECPWNKALYMDGAVYLPQELAQIQDLMIEKQLRVHAMPEELEILREDQ